MDDEARIDKYAGWLVQNKDKKGSPEFGKVAEAYKTLRSGAPSTPEVAPYKEAQSFKELPGVLYDNLGATASNAPGDAKAIGSALKDAAGSPIETAKSMASGASDLIGGVANKLGADEANAWLADRGLAKRRAPEDVARENKTVEDKGSQLYNDWLTPQGLSRRAATEPVSMGLDLVGAVSAKQLLSGKVPTVAKAAVAVPKAVVSRAKALNKLKVDYPEASGDVARQLEDLSKSYDLKDVSTSNQGTMGAINKAFTDNKVDIDEGYIALKDLLDPQKNTSPTDEALRLQAAKAFASGDHRKADHSLRAQISAVEQLVGHTKQGAKMVHALKKQVEISRLADKRHGGLSRLTSKLNPISAAGEGRFGNANSVKAIASLAGHSYMGPAAPYTLGAQLGTVLVGEGVDWLTGQKSQPNLYMKQNRKNPKQNIGEGLPDIYEERRAAAATDTQASEAATAAKATEKANADLVRSRLIADKALATDFNNIYKPKKLKEADFMSGAPQSVLRDRALGEKAKDPKTIAAEFKRMYSALGYKSKDPQFRSGAPQQVKDTRVAAKATEAKAATKAAAEAKVLETAAKETIAAQKAIDTEALREKAAADKKAETLSNHETKQKQDFLKFTTDKEALAAKAPKIPKAAAAPKAADAPKLSDTPALVSDLVQDSEGFWRNKKGQMTDSKGKRIFNEAAYRAATTNIKNLTKNARRLANESLSENVSSVIMKALDDLEVARGREFQKERVAIVSNAMKKVFDEKQYDIIEEALQPLADVFKPKD